MANRRLKYLVNNHEFTLRPTSRKVMTEMVEYSEEITRNMMQIERVLEMKANGEDISEEEIPDIPDEFQMAFDMFCIVTEGPHDKLDPEDFDIHIATEAVENFMPSRKSLL